MLLRISPIRIMSFPTYVSTSLVLSCVVTNIGCTKLTVGISRISICMMSLEGSRTDPVLECKVLSKDAPTKTKVSFLRRRVFSASIQELDFKVFFCVEQSGSLFAPPPSPPQTPRPSQSPHTHGSGTGGPRSFSGSFTSW